MAIDLDAAKAARQEARRKEKKKPPRLTYGGKSWDLPLELPLDTIIAITELEVAIERGTQNDAARLFRELSATLIGDEAAIEFNANKPSVQDIAALIAGLVDEYGLAPGESEASQAS